MIPKVLRDARHWHAGTTFIVEEVPPGILLKPVGTFAPAGQMPAAKALLSHANGVFVAKTVLLGGDWVGPRNLLHHSQ